MKDLSQSDTKEFFQYKNIIVVVIIVIVFVFFLKGLFGDYQRDLKKIEKETQLLSKAEDKIKEWKSLKQKRRALTKNFLGQEPLALKKYVEKEARNTGVVINSLKTNKKEVNSFHSVSMELFFSSSYRNLVSFIEALEKKNIFIDRLSLRKERSGSMRVDVVLNTMLIKR